MTRQHGTRACYVIDAAATWELVDELLAAGVTRRQIAQAITGRPETLALQIRRSRVTQRTADAVTRLAGALTAPPTPTAGPAPAPGTPEHFRWWWATQRQTDEADGA